MARCAPLVTALVSVALILPSTAGPEDPGFQLWHNLKKILTGPDGPAFFEKNLKDTELPPLAGKLVSAEPADHPSVLVLQMYDSDQPEVTLHLMDGNSEAHMPGPMAIGSSIQFYGIGVSFTQSPFMVTFRSDASPERRRN